MQLDKKVVKPITKARVLWHISGRPKRQGGEWYGNTGDLELDLV
jgi:hypothetical protein